MSGEKINNITDQTEKEELLQDALKRIMEVERAQEERKQQRSAFLEAFHGNGGKSASELISTFGNETSFSAHRESPNEDKCKSK